MTLPIPYPETIERLTPAGIKAHAQRICELVEGLPFSHFRHSLISGAHYELTNKALVPRRASGGKLGLRKRREILADRMLT